MKSLSKYYFLFNQETWYENKFGAHLKDSLDVQEKYKSIKKNFTDPTQKPEYFDFNNQDLNDMLGETFQRASTWKEFLDIINTYSTDKKCRIVYPWLEKAIASITNTDLHYTPSIINLYDNPKLYDAPFKRIAPTKLQEGGATRKKHKSISSKLSLSKVYNYKLSKYL
jgi:hypothetical protein